jgi:hypothetical protein
VPIHLGSDISRHIHQGSLPQNSKG